MSKIMLVEDDESLREIYSIRLTAEGYTIVTARDGEEALAVAVKERPDLIVSDVMMPKISGFDMLDILRSTPETQGIRVIMMTALSSDDQRQRGENLGADRYLVKSQVGIEDVVNAVHEVLGDRNAAGIIDPAMAQEQAAAAAASAGPTIPMTPTTTPIAQPNPTATAIPTPTVAMAPNPTEPTGAPVPTVSAAPTVPVAPTVAPAPVTPVAPVAPTPTPMNSTEPVMPTTPTAPTAPAQ